MVSAGAARLLSPRAPLLSAGKQIGGHMRRSTWWYALGCVAVAGVVYAGVVLAAEDPAAVVESRQATMKAQGKDMVAIKAFIEGKGELAAAQAAGVDLVARLATIPTLFPKGTGMAELPGKSYAKPVIWTETDKFAATVKTVEAKAQALEAALKGGDKAAIQTAFGDIGKNGCDACHGSYRENKPS
jgi:cytochrome c556